MSWSRARRRAVGGLGAVLVVGGVVVAGTSGGPSEDDDTLRVLLLGDSITQGQAGDWTWRYRLWQAIEEAEERDVDFVGPDDELRNGSDDYRDPGFDRDHAALWGTPLTPAFYAPEELAREHRPDVVVVELGVNDLGWQREPPEAVAADMRTTIESLRAGSPGVDVVVVHVPLVAFPGVGELNRLYDELATDLDSDDERVVVAPADEGFVSDPSAADADTYDGIHPNARGEIKIAASVAVALAELGIGAPG